MPRKIVIQDNAVLTSLSQFAAPVCGAIREGTHILIQPITQNERQIMIKQLILIVNKLIDIAETMFQRDSNNLEDDEIDLNYITRLSTHEHFFYTQQPLTLDEFQDLQNQIAIKAKQCFPGVQLILGSFAVLTANSEVMNVVPHITCGLLPEFHFIVKNYTSELDYRYKETDPQGDTFLLGIFDLDTYSPSNLMPSIIVNQMNYFFTFNNVVRCKTPGGIPFLTAVDICIDHSLGIALANIAALAASDWDVLNLLISHVVISNWIKLFKTNCLENFVMHVDPECSPKGCKENAPQELGFYGKLTSEKNELKTYIFNVTANIIQTLVKDTIKNLANNQEKIDTKKEVTPLFSKLKSQYTNEYFIKTNLTQLFFKTQKKIEKKKQCINKLDNSKNY